MSMRRTFKVMQEYSKDRVARRANLRPTVVARQLSRSAISADDSDIEPEDNLPNAIDRDADYDNNSDDEDSEYVPSDAEIAAQYKTPANPRKRKRKRVTVQSDSDADDEDVAGPSRVRQKKQTARKPTATKPTARKPTAPARKRNKIVIEESSDSAEENDGNEDGVQTPPPVFNAKGEEIKYIYKKLVDPPPPKDENRRQWSWTPRKEKPAKLRPEVPHGWSIPDFPHWSPLRQFMFLFGDAFELWLKYTNLRGPQLFHERWHRLTRAELWRFIAICLVRGLQKTRTHKQVWSNDPRVNNTWIKGIMSFNRWWQIYRSTRFYNLQESYDRGVGDPKSPNYSRLFKIENYICSILVKFQQIHNPTKELALDETMCKCKGSFRWLCVIPSKPIPKGVKLFVLACSGCAWVLNVIPYAAQCYDFTEELGATGGYMFACLRSENLLGRGKCYLLKGHEVYSDRYYTMFGTIEKLLDWDTYYVGTIMRCRGLPAPINNKNVPGKFKEGRDKDGKKVLRPVKMVRGDMKYMHTDKITLVNWLDGGNCLMAWSLPNVVLDTETVYRNVKATPQSEHWIIDCEYDAPKPAVMFNGEMGGVDLNNQIIAAGSFFWKCDRWFMTVVWKMLEFCISNGFIASKTVRLTLKASQYRLQLVDEIVEMADMMDPPRRHLPLPDTPDCIAHLPMDQVQCHDLVKNKPIQSHPGRLLRGTNVEIRKTRLSASPAHFMAEATTRGACVAHAQRKDTALCCYGCRVRLHPGWCTYAWHHFVNYVWYDLFAGGPLYRTKSTM